MIHSPKNIFITGIAGFIGFHLALFLLRRGDVVLGCDHFNAYYDVELKEKRALLLESKGAFILRQDVKELKALPEGVTHVVHLAAQAGVRYSITHPHSYIEANVVGFFHLLECLRHSSKVKLIFASSSSVYGTNQKIPFSEDDPTDSPANLYAASKKSGEVMAKSYHHLYGIPMTGLRYFTVYGPWGRPDMAYYSFAEKILKKQPIQVFNHGKLKRDFTYIDDIVFGTVQAIDNCSGFELFNLGNTQPRSVMELIELLEQELGERACLELLPMQQGEVETTYADIQKAASLLSYAPQITLEEGIHRFATWYRAFQEERGGS